VPVQGVGCLAVLVDIDARGEDELLPSALASIYPCG
jgi:hypothetical protein